MKKTRKGFTIVELMVASAILVLLLGGFLTTFNSILRTAKYSEGLSLAYTACLSQLEQMVSHDFSLLKRDYSAGGTPGNTFIPAGFPSTFQVSGNITINDRTDLYGGGWTLATGSASWSGRGNHTSLVYDNKMWVMGGWGAIGSRKRDAWYSSNGINWTQATDTAAWPDRWGHSSLVYDNKMWVMGGFSGTGGYMNDVWYSADGVTWTATTTSAAWSVRWTHKSLVYNNRMWVMGGEITMPIWAYLNDVWYSADGTTWFRATASAWPGRRDFAVLVYDNKMWVMGGFAAGGSTNDIWNSSDGITWTQVIPVSIWTPRGGHTALVYDNKMWVIGGDTGSAALRDVWYSADGINWTKAVDAAEWPARFWHTSLVYDNKMWVIGGYPSFNDVWSSCGYDRLFEIFITVCWRLPDGRLFGEDANLDGIWDQATEDANGNGQFDSPAQLRVLLSEKDMLNLRKIFLGRQ